MEFRCTKCDMVFYSAVPIVCPWCGKESIAIVNVRSVKTMSDIANAFSEVERYNVLVGEVILSSHTFFNLMRGTSKDHFDIDDTDITQKMLWGARVRVEDDGVLVVWEDIVI